jgi:SSS family transporter
LNTETIIFIGVAIYLALMLGIGVYASKGSGTTEDFIVSGRRMPIWLCSATVVATWFGAGPMMGAAGASYEQGLLGVIADPFGGALVIFIVGFFFIRFFRRLGVLTVVDMLQMRFGTTAATIAAAGLIISVIGWAAAMLVAFGTVFNSMTGIPLEAGIIAGAIVVFIYTAIGGMWAVALTDFVQMLIICIGLIVLFAVVLGDVGGWSTVSAQLPEHTFRMTPLENDAGAWLQYLRAWVIFGLADITSQTLMQRGLAARSEQVAQNAFYIGGALYLAFGMIPVLLGIIASVTMPGLGETASVIPELALDHLHPVMIAIFVGALLAAIMSSTDSMLLSVSSILSTNLYPLLKPDAPDGERLLVARIAVPVAGVLAVIVALYVQVVYDLIQDANSPLLAVVVVPFVAGIWWPKANRTGALAAMAVGFVAWISVVLLAPGWPGDLLGMLACLLTLAIVAPLTQRADPPLPTRDRHGAVVEFRDRLGVLPLFRRVDDDRE